MVGEDLVDKIFHKVNAVLTFLANTHNDPIQIVPPPLVSSVQAPPIPVTFVMDTINSSLDAPEGVCCDNLPVPIAINVGVLNVPPPPIQIPNFNSPLLSRFVVKEFDEQHGENDVQVDIME